MMNITLPKITLTLCFGGLVWLLNGCSSNPQMTKTPPIIPSSSNVSTTQIFLITTHTEKGTPEDTVKNAYNILMNRPVQEALPFFESKTSNLKNRIIVQQNLFKNNLQSMEIEYVKYSDNKNYARVDLMLFPLAQAGVDVRPQAGLLNLHKQADGTWKILAD